MKKVPYSGIEEYLKEMANLFGVKLYWECGEHTFGYDDWKRVLEYRTVSVDMQELVEND